MNKCYKILDNCKMSVFYNKPTPAPPDVKSGQALRGGEFSFPMQFS